MGFYLYYAIHAPFRDCENDLNTIWSHTDHIFFFFFQLFHCFLMHPCNTALWTDDYMLQNVTDPQILQYSNAVLGIAKLFDE